MSIAQCIKPFDEKLKRYKRLIENVRGILRRGLNERNSYNFYIYIDEMKPLIKHLKQKYSMRFGDDVETIIEAYG